MKTLAAALNCLLWAVSLNSPFCLPAQEKPRDQPVALLNGEPITDKDLDVDAKLVQLEQEAYQLRLEALEEAIGKRLLEKAAAERNVTVEELVKSEVESKVSDPSPEEVEAFYQQQKSRLQNRPLEDVRGQIERFLKSAKLQTVRQAYLAKLREESKVEILLEAPRLPVEVGNSPRRGPQDAPVTIVEFSDYQCPYCKRAQPTLRRIQQEYGDTVSMVYKDLPLRQIHPEAQKAAEAARCAGDQGKFWEYHDALFELPRITNETFPQIAESLQLDAVAFQKCLDSDMYFSSVEQDLKQASEVGASSTPTFYINGIQLRGSQPFEAFKQIIDAELAAANR